MSEFAELLPKIASQPIAIAAYVILAGVWLVALVRRQKAKVFLAALDRIPSEQREAFARECGYRYETIAQLPERDRLSALTFQYFLIAFIVTVAALFFIAVVAILQISSGGGIPREYVPIKLAPNVYESSEFDNGDKQAKADAIKGFLKALGFDIRHFDPFPGKLVSAVDTDGAQDAGDLQLINIADGKTKYRLTVTGAGDELRPVLLRTMPAQ
jgi:hypothetical protein